jgi:aspartate/tyrosine/aromatic aminotransferase
MEAVWGQTETSLGPATQACKSGAPLTNRQATVLKSAIGMRYTRSVYAPEMLDRIWQQNLDETRKRIIHERRDRLEDAFRRRHSGLHPAGTEALGLLIDSIYEPMVLL